MNFYDKKKDFPGDLGNKDLGHDFGNQDLNK